MKKLFIIPSVLLLMSSFLVGCGGDDPDPVVVDDYAVVVTAPSSVTYTVDKTRAKEGETVTLVISNVAAGFSIKDVKMNGAALTPASDNKTYSFKMPNTSADIVIRVSVSGDVIIDGDFAAVFNETSEGIWEAKNVSVPVGASDFAYFDVKVGDYSLKALDLDESRSFADVNFTVSKETQFQIAPGATYDFKYDTNYPEAPLSIQRRKIDVLPSTSDALGSILIDSWSVRSEPAMFIDDLVGIVYEKSDTSTTDLYKQKFTWNKYKDNTTVAVIEDLLDESPEKYVYRHYDEATRTYDVVDTYNMKVGEQTVNDDRYRESYNNYGAYSARYEVIDGDDYGYRYAKSLAHVNRELNSAAHMPAYLLERDIMYAYRVGFSGSDDEVSSENLKIESTKTDDGFDTVIDSYVEYDSQSGAYTSDHHEAYVYKVTINFDVRGAVKHIDFKRTTYSKDQWDFTTHKPLPGQAGSVKQKLSATYKYGAIPNKTCDFDITPYFVSSINSYQMVNAKYEDKKASGDSYIGLEDKLMIMDNTGKIPDSVSISYSPETALDLWQYGPVSSSNEEVVAKVPTDVYYQMSAVNEGDAVVTISNHVTTPRIKGAEYSFNVHVKATKDIRSFYIQSVYGDSSYSPVDTWNSATVHANGEYKFSIASSPSGAPLIYEAKSNSNYLKIKSKPNSRDLVIDTTPAKNITENVTATVTISSTRMEEGGSPTTLIFYIMPAQANPVGTWKADGLADTYMYFTTEVYSGEYFKGRIVDHYIDDEGKDHGTDTFYFYYKYNGSYIDAKIYAMDIHTLTNVPDVSDMYLEFYYEGATGKYGVFLAQVEYDDYYEDATYYPILGSTDDTGLVITGYQAFTKQK